MLTQDELFEALGIAMEKIEAAGASVPLTDAVIIVGDVRSAIGNSYNSPKQHAIDGVRRVLRKERENVIIESTIKRWEKENPEAFKTIQVRALKDVSNLS